MLAIKHSLPYVLHGSAAAHYWWPHWREPKDFDLYSFVPMQGFDLQKATKDNGLVEIIEACANSPCIEVRGLLVPVAPPHVLLAIKAIHINYLKKWRKNIGDYCKMRRLVHPINLDHIIAKRCAYLDGAIGIQRHLQTPAGFWGMNDADRIAVLEPNPLKQWCIYACEVKLRRYAQDLCCELLDAQSCQTPANT